jgi:hypothetical protein
LNYEQDIILPGYQSQAFLIIVAILRLTNNATGCIIPRQQIQPVALLATATPNKWKRKDVGKRI